MHYINNSIKSITTKWLSQLLQKVEANKLCKKIKLWSKFTGLTCVPCVRPPAGAPAYL